LSLPSAIAFATAAKLVPLPEAITPNLRGGDLTRDKAERRGEINTAPDWQLFWLFCVTDSLISFSLRAYSG
ncbi:MAG: hypothetical protein RLZZ69_2877, partial [Cyanobacteriota bacterium]